MRKILLFLLIIGTFSTVFAQTTVHIKVTVTNSADLQSPTVNEIVSKVNITRLRDAIQANYSLERKDSLTVHLAFYNKEYIGALKMNSSNTLSSQQYVQQWLSSHTEGNHILFLFSKEKDQDQFEYDMLEVSHDMKNQHLFTEVMDFIRANLSGSPAQVVENGTKFLANALRPVWDNRSITQGKKQVAASTSIQDKYKRFHFNFLYGFWAGHHLIDLKPFSPPMSMENMAKVWFIKKGNTNPDTLKPTIPTYVYTPNYPNNEIILQNPFNNNIVRQILLSLGLIDNTPAMLLTIDSKTYRMIEFVNQQMLFSSSTSVAKWQWETDIENGPYVLKTTSGLRNTQSGDKYLYAKVDSKDLFNDGDIKPPWISAGYRFTYCNVFASDFSRQKLFKDIFTNIADEAAGNENYAPWGKHASANILHYKINKNATGMFRLLAINKPNNEEGKDAWDYTDAGYIVYLTAFGSNMQETLLNLPTEVALQKEIDKEENNYGSGHIAICFDKEGKKVVQAGSSNGVGVFPGAKSAHVYLGYILNLKQ